MKKHLISLISTGLAFLSFVNTGISQENSYSELPPVTITASTPSTSVNDKVSKSFNRLYKDATNASWYPIEKKFFVKFILKEQENAALFNKGGRLIYHISYGGEKHLPAEVRHLVKTNYYDQNIKRVYNVEQGDRNIWVVSLEDNKEYVMVRIENNELEETQRFKVSK